MELHKGDVNVMSFVQETCDIFSSQASAKNIRLQVLYENDALEGSLRIEDSDLLRCDKFKIAQVVRTQAALLTLH